MQTLARIPRGEVRTYSWLAEHVGRPTAVRAIANFVARNIVPFVVPCHRVLAAGGKIGGFSAQGGVMTKRLMLAIEGARLNGDPAGR